MDDETLTIPVPLVSPMYFPVDKPEMVQDVRDTDMGDVTWSCGNPLYYGYGFDIEVEDI